MAGDYKCCVCGQYVVERESHLNIRYAIRYIMCLLLWIAFVVLVYIKTGHSKLTVGSGILLDYNEEALEMTQ